MEISLKGQIENNINLVNELTDLKNAARYSTVQVKESNLLNPLLDKGIVLPEKCVEELKLYAFNYYSGGEARAFEKKLEALNPETSLEVLYAALDELVENCKIDHTVKVQFI